MKLSLKHRYVIAGTGGALMGAGLTAFSGWSGLTIVQSGILACLIGWMLGVFLAKGPVAMLARINRRLSRISAGDVRPRPEITTSDPLMTSVFTSIADVAEYVQSVKDETDRKVNESQSILDDLDDAVITVDASGRVVRCNPSAGIFFGQLPFRQMVGLTFLEATLNKNLDDVVQKCLETQSAQEALMDIHSPKTRAVAVSVIPRVSRTSEFMGAVTVLHDITEIRNLDRLQKEFTANASHELRTPVASIRVMADSLLNGAIEDAELGPKFLHSIVDSATRLSSLIDDLLFLNIQDARSDASREPVSTRALVDSVIDKFRPQAAGRHILLTSGEVCGEWVLGDTQDLWRALANLVENAIRYTNVEGHIDVSAIVADGHVVISVRDDGIGIATEHQEKVFERFFRADVARSRESGGTGLGLAIVKNIAEAHKGFVSVESAFGEGSVFRLHLPVYEVLDWPQQEGITPDLPPAGDKKAG